MTYNSKGPVPAGSILRPWARRTSSAPARTSSLIAFSRMVPVALEAAPSSGAVEHQRRSDRSPQHRASGQETLIQSRRPHGPRLVVDGGHALYGIAGEVAATVAEGAFDHLDAPVLRIGAPHHPVPCSKTLEAGMVPSPERSCKQCNLGESNHDPSNPAQSLGPERP